MSDDAQSSSKFFDEESDEGLNRQGEHWGQVIVPTERDYEVVSEFVKKFGARND